MRAADTILKCLKEDFMLALQYYVSVYSVVYGCTRKTFNLLNFIIYDLVYLVSTMSFFLTWTLLNFSQRLETYFVIFQKKKTSRKRTF